MYMYVYIQSVQCSFKMYVIHVCICTRVICKHKIRFIFAMKSHVLHSMYMCVNMHMIKVETLETTSTESL